MNNDTPTTLRQDIDALAARVAALEAPQGHNVENLAKAIAQNINARRYRTDPSDATTPAPTPTDDDLPPS
jgi:hypothetical protein